ncbi:multicopper oxidase family protein [Actinotalea sp.]|uniref:multicopper oxidase family protein n=1 Tax=Actinotalea sp. TaxID=1872145 RepID=UPI0035627F0F
MTPEPISRRRALQLGLLGAGTLTIGVVGLGTQGWPPFGTSARGDGATASPDADAADRGASLIEPELLASAAGILDLDLLVAESDVVVAGRRVRMLTYNGTVPGPTLHLRPGDRLRVRLANGLDSATNLHTHGLVVSAEGSSDNPFVRIDPGDAFEYTIDLPEDHPTGVFWYHPHHHGTVADQVFGGLYGAIVVDTEPWDAAEARILVVSDVTFADGRVAAVSRPERMHGRAGRTVLVNGQVAPELTVPAGSTQRLLVINACTSRYLDLDPGSGRLRVRGFDGGQFPEPVSGDRVLLAPGNRADLELDVPAGGAVLTARAHDRGAVEMGMGGVVDEADATLLTVRAGTGVAAPLPPVRAGVARDLRSVTVDRARTLDLTMGMGRGMGRMSFLIDGKEFDAGRVDQQVRLGDVEEWTVRNSSTMDHPFHLHVWPMQLVRAGGETVELVDRRDVVDVPAGQEVTVRIAFDTFPGTTVYHCHVLDHEDLGMMGTIEAG